MNVLDKKNVGFLIPLNDISETLMLSYFSFSSFFFFLFLFFLFFNLEVTFKVNVKTLLQLDLSSPTILILTCNIKEKNV